MGEVGGRVNDLWVCVFFLFFFSEAKSVSLVDQSCWVSFTAG